MSIVISNMQERARQSSDRVPSSLWASSGSEAQVSLDNVSRLASQSQNDQVHQIHETIGLVSAMNESANASIHIANIASSQQAQIDKSMHDVVREQSLVSRHLLDYVYLKDRYITSTHITQATIIMLAALFLCGTLWNLERLDPISAVLIIMAIAAVYLAYVIYQMAYMGRRYREAGRRLSWNATGQMESEMMRLFGGRKTC